MVQAAGPAASLKVWWLLAEQTGRAVVAAPDAVAGPAEVVAADDVGQAFGNSYVRAGRSISKDLSLLVVFPRPSFRCRGSRQRVGCDHDLVYQEVAEVAGRRVVQRTKQGKRGGGCVVSKGVDRRREPGIGP